MDKLSSDMDACPAAQLRRMTIKVSVDNREVVRLKIELDENSDEPSTSSGIYMG